MKMFDGLFGDFKKYWKTTKSYAKKYKIDIKIKNIWNWLKMEFKK
jgi:hypothetical protein